MRYFLSAPRVEKIHEALRMLYPLAHAHKLPKTKLNPRELELSQQYLMRQPKSARAATAQQKHNRKEGYQHLRYTKRLDDDEDDSFDSESSYGEDSEDSD